MAETQKEKEDRLRREAEAKARTGGDTSFVAVNTLPKKETTTVTRTMETQPMTEKTGGTSEEMPPAGTQGQHWRGEPWAKNPKVGGKETTEPGTSGQHWRGEDMPLERTEAERMRMEADKKLAAAGVTKTRQDTKTTTPGADWDTIQHPGGCGPEGETDYGTRPVSDLAKPTQVKDKADLAAVRMMDREKADREKMDRERIMTTATMDAAAARTAMTSKEMTKAESEADRDRMKTGAVVTGAALATGAAVKRTEPAAGERTIRQGAAVDTPATTTMTTKETTRITPMPTPIPPTTTTTTPVRTPATMSERDRMHAEDPSVHPDWETQPQINAPRDVGIPTAEGQADAARLRSGQRRSDEAKEPRIDRRGGEYDVPLASGARTTETKTTTGQRMGTETKDDRSMTQKMRDAAHDTKEKTKETARDVKEDVDRKI